MESLTGKSVVEFVLNCRLRKAAKLIIEENMTMREVMMHIGIEKSCRLILLIHLKRYLAKHPQLLQQSIKNDPLNESDKINSD